MATESDFKNKLLPGVVLHQFVGLVVMFELTLILATKTHNTYFSIDYSETV